MPGSLKVIRAAPSKGIIGIIGFSGSSVLNPTTSYPKNMCFFIDGGMGDHVKAFYKVLTKSDRNHISDRYGYLAAPIQLYESPNRSIVG